MNISNSKAEKLVDIAKMYYQNDLTQNEIAKILGVSRPLVSRMLSEAKELGIVKIEILSPFEGNHILLNHLRNIFNIKGGFIIADSANETLTNKHIAHSAIEFLRNTLPDVKNVGIGWGTIIGALVECLERQEIIPNLAKKVCPLIGSISVSNRNYHSNENVRIFAQQTFATPIYLHAPAFAETEQEMLLFKDSENFKSIESVWEQLDVAFVNIGNYPSVPDFASAARYGDRLSKNKAVGRLLSYYFDLNGEIFRSNTDYAIQIPIETLSRCKNVIGICAANIKPKSLIGALRTGMIQYLIAPEQVVKQGLELK